VVLSEVLNSEDTTSSSASDARAKIRRIMESSSFLEFEVSVVEEFVLKINVTGIMSILAAHLPQLDRFDWSHQHQNL
jgi:hypothetical protein